MNTWFMIYTAERVPSRAEQRAIDTQRGELALTLASLLLRRLRTAAEANDKHH